MTDQEEARSPKAATQTLDKVVGPTIVGEEHSSETTPITMEKMEVEAIEEEHSREATPTWEKVMAEAMTKRVEKEHSERTTPSSETTPSSDQPLEEPMVEGEESGETSPTTGESTPTTTSEEATPTCEVVTETMVEEEKRLKEGASRDGSVESEQRGEVSSHLCT